MADEKRHNESLFRRYLRGETGPREEAELERLSQSDALLAEALEGIRSQPETDHAAAVKRLRGRLPKANRRAVVYWPRIAAAASLLLLLGFAALWLPNQLDGDATVAMREEAEAAPEIPESAATTAKIESSATDGTVEEAVSNTPLREEATEAESVDREVSPESVAQPPPAEILPPPPPPPAPVSEAEIVEEEAAPESVQADQLRDHSVTAPKLSTRRENSPAPATYPAAPTATAPAGVQRPRSRTQDAFSDSGLREISGYVTGANDEPIPNARVILPGQLVGEPTDSSGFFRLLTDQTVRNFTVAHPAYLDTEVDLPLGENETQINLDPRETGAEADDEWAFNGARTTIYPNPDPVYAVPEGGFAALRRTIVAAKPADLEGGKVRIAFTVLPDGRLRDFQLSGRSSKALQDFVRDYLLLNSRWELKGGEESARVVMSLRF